jgi:DNA-binding IclR family transcriptional regulator
MVIKDAMTSQYVLGPGILRLLPGALAGMGAIARLERAALEELAEATGETVALHIRVGIERVCVDEVSSPQLIRYTSSVGSRAPLHVGAAGKVLMAHLDEDERRRALELLADHLRSDGTDPAELRRMSERIRRQGWATSVSERVEGASAISVLVRTHVADVALSVLGPTGRLPRARLLELLPALRATGERIGGVAAGDAEERTGEVAG